MGKQKQTRKYGVDPHEDRAKLCCACVPLRFAVFLIAVFSIATSVLVLFAKSLGVDTAAAFGGYTLQSKTFLLFIEVSGAIWGFIGAQGAVRCHSNSVNVFFYYQVARCVCWLGVFYYDLPELMACEKWVTNMASQPAWNPQMYQIAMEGLCFQKRLYFYCVNFPLFLMFCYFTYVNYQFVNSLNEGFAYRSYANIGDKAALGLFSASSLAEHTPLNVANQLPEEAPRSLQKESLTDNVDAWGSLPSSNFGYPEEGKGEKGKGKGGPSGESSREQPRREQPKAAAPRAAVDAAPVLKDSVTDHVEGWGPLASSNFGYLEEGKGGKGKGKGAPSAAA